MQQQAGGFLPVSAAPKCFLTDDDAKHGAAIDSVNAKQQAAANELVGGAVDDGENMILAANGLIDLRCHSLECEGHVSFITEWNGDGKVVHPRGEGRGVFRGDRRKITQLSGEFAIVWHIDSRNSGSFGFASVVRVRSIPS